MSSELTFDVFGFDVSQYPIDTQSKVIVAPLAAVDLIKMEGIANQELFSWNVRQSLGRTKVNKDIAASVKTSAEHKYFLLFHNGLTVLCKKILVGDGKITISGYTVVNGCQSLTTLYENRTKVTPNLRVLTRLIQITADSDLALKITHHSNNQNGITARDLQSNNPIQSRLQAEFSNGFPDIFYEIKRGEGTTKSRIIDNELAARILLAFDLKEPWSCHQSYKLFDDLHAQLFGRPEVTAARIVALNAAYETVLEGMVKIEDKLMAGYTLTKFYVFSLLREVLELDSLGQDFCVNPASFLNQTNGESRIRAALRPIVSDLIIELNAEAKDRASTSDPIDYKRELKSQKAVKALSRNIIPQYQKLLIRKRIPAFSEEWAKSEQQPKVGDANAVESTPT